jgi:aminoglycoside 6'-N-acetyltransferase
VKVSLRPLAESDFPALARWLSDPRVLEWVYGRDEAFDLAKVAKEFGPLMRGEEDPRFRAQIIECDGRAAGYVQTYPVAKASDYELDDATDVWGADLFLGEPELWGRGLGTEALRIAAADVFRECGARSVVIDPRVENGRAIRSYEKAGFRKVRVLAGHEMHEGVLTDAWLLVLDRPA